MDVAVLLRNKYDNNTLSDLLCKVSKFTAKKTVVATCRVCSES